jgi:hypothetical protein
MAKRNNRTLRGGEPRGLRPDWRPLLDFAPDEIPEFMWMYRVELDDGSVIEAYKHSWTRQYLHLDERGRAYEFIGGRSRSWEEVDARALLRKVLDGFEPRANIVRQNEWIDGEGITWARSATRHRVPRAKTLSVIQEAGICFEDRTTGDRSRRLFFFGDDEDERPLEVAAVRQDDGGLHVIHSMPLRGRYEEKYTEALRWRK